VNGDHDFDISLTCLAIREIYHFPNIGVCLMYPVKAGDAEIEIPLIDIGRDLLGPEDLSLPDTVVGYAGVIVPIRGPYLESASLKSWRVCASRLPFGSAIEIMPVLFTLKNHEGICFLQ
jgi:hypothetical protein